MLKKIITKAHWLVGITLGTMLAIMGLTGGLMAFDKEISRFFLGAYSQTPPQQVDMLSLVELYQRVHTANPTRVMLALTPASDGRAAQVEFATGATSGPGLGNGDNRNEIRLVNPYTGALLPESSLSQSVQGFMAWLREIHQGHWLPPNDPIGKIIFSSVGICAVFLFGMALTGLYLRWPRGRAARSWSAWFKINWQVKGRAFLWNLHTVLGTLVFIPYLISAHSGALQNSTVGWYGNTIRSLVGAPQAGPPGGPGMDAGPGGMGSGTGMQAGPPQVRPAMPLDDSKLWSAFLLELPAFKTATMQITRLPNQAAEFAYVPLDADSEDRGVVVVDTVAGTVRNTPVSAVPSLSFAEFVVEKNQDIHEGRIFGKLGVLVMMLAALSMPVFYVTGWMMYLQRKKRQRATAVNLQKKSA